MNDKKRRALNTFSPVKNNTSLKCTLKIPGIFAQLSDHKIATGPQRQPHRIAKIEQPLARFPPAGCFRLHIYDMHVCMYVYMYIYAIDMNVYKGRSKDTVCRNWELTGNHTNVHEDLEFATQNRNWRFVW